MAKTKTKWKFVSEYPITEYQCGAKAGDQVRLRRELVIHDLRNMRIGQTYPAGEIWTVLSGAKEEPVVVWLRKPNGDRHTWDDSDDFWTWFEKIPPDVGETA